jgi:ABC-2 type transport system permease protein
MLNVAKMDFYRLIRSRSFYVILLIVAGFMLFDVMIVNSQQQKIIKQAEYNQSQTQQQTEASDEQDNVTVGIIYDGSDLMREKITLMDVIYSLLSSGVMMLFTGIFAVLFVCSESSSGYIKNTASYIKRRWYVVLSKVIVMSIFVLIEFLIMLIIIGLGFSFLINNFSLNLSWKLLQYIGLQYLLHLAFSTIITMISVVVLNTAICMAISICICSGITSLIINFISTIKINGYNIGKHLPEYLITTNVQALPSISSLDVALRVIFVSAITVLVYNVISCIVIEKRDIK